VVIGGAGGIGEAFSEYLIRKYGARMIWIGRREKDVEIEAKIRRLGEVGEVPMYIAADARDYEALRGAYEEIKRKYERIHGVVHSALVLRDRSLGKMEEEEFREGLRAKADVSVRMAQVFGGEELDWMMFFSSMQTFSKAAGQSNYAAGCTFGDAVAGWLRGRAGYEVKVMNWGYWGSVGAVSGAEYRKRMEEAGVG